MDFSSTIRYFCIVFFSPTLLLEICCFLVILAFAPLLAVDAEPSSSVIIALSSLIKAFMALIWLLAKNSACCAESDRYTGAICCFPAACHFRLLQPNGNQHNTLMALRGCFPLWWWETNKHVVSVHVKEGGRLGKSDLCSKALGPNHWLPSSSIQAGAIYSLYFFQSLYCKKKTTGVFFPFFKT